MANKRLFVPYISVFRCLENLRDSNITGLAIDCTSFGDEEIEAETWRVRGRRSSWLLPFLAVCLQVSFLRGTHFEGFPPFPSSKGMGILEGLPLNLLWK